MVCDPFNVLLYSVCCFGEDFPEMINGISWWGLWEVMGHEGRGLMNGIHALGDSRELPHSFLHVRTWFEGTRCESGNRSSPDAETAALILDFAAQMD